MIETAITFWTDIKRYEDMLEADPRSYCFAPLSELYRKLGLLDDAIAVAEKGCSLHPEYAGGFLALASALLDKGRTEEGRAALERVVTLNPDNLKAQKLLSQIYVDAGENELAGQALRRVLADNPEDSESALLLRTLSGAEGAEEEVLEEVELVEELTEELDEEAVELADIFEPDEEGSGVAGSAEFAEAPVEQIAEEGGADSFLEELPPDFFEELPEEEGEPEVIEAPPVAAHGKDPLTTATMAELYVSQGFPDKALRIYRALLEDEPANLAYSRRAAELERAIAAAAAEKASATAAARQEEAPRAVEVAAVEVDAGAGSELQAVVILEKWLENIKRRKQHAL